MINYDQMQKIYERDRLIEIDRSYLNRIKDLEYVIYILKRLRGDLFFRISDISRKTVEEWKKDDN